MLLAVFSWIIIFHHLSNLIKVKAVYLALVKPPKAPIFSPYLIIEF